MLPSVSSALSTFPNKLTFTSHTSQSGSGKNQLTKKEKEGADAILENLLMEDVANAHNGGSDDAVNKAEGKLDDFYKRREND